MTAAPAPDRDPAADPPPPTSPLVRVGRLVDRANLLTVGGWGLFAASTVLAAALAAPAPGPTETVEAVPVAAPEPVRTAAVPARSWPAPPDGFEPPPVEEPPPAAAFAAAEPCTQADVWADTLSDLPPAAADDLNAIRERFGSVVPFAPPPPVPTAPVPALPVRSRATPADAAALHVAVRTARANLAGAFTPGYRRVEAGGANGEPRVTLVPGPLRETGRPLDLALTGPGWFALLGVNSEQPPTLTRAGLFGVRGGFLVSAPAPDRRVMGEGGGPIAVPADATALRFDETGRLHVTRPVGGEPREKIAGRVAVVAPADPAAVAPLSGSLYRPTAPIHPVPDAPVRPGCVEGANVDPGAELGRLDVAERLLGRLGPPGSRLAGRD